MQKAIASALIVASLTGCAARPTGENYRPIIDMQGRDPAKFEQDLADCQAYATQVSGAAERAVAGAAVGAAFGAILAAAAGVRQRGRYAAVSGISGAAHAAAAGERDQRNIIRTCLAGRGYSVLL